jgi:hypothetical protein
MEVNKKQVIEKLEKLVPGQSLVYKLSSTFGGHTVVLDMTEDKGKKVYALRWGKDEDSARRSEPFIKSEKAKKLASWVAERAPQWVGERPGPALDRAA